jgi:hypothetical protein
MNDQKHYYKTRIFKDDPKATSEINNQVHVLEEEGTKGTPLVRKPATSGLKPLSFKNVADHFAAPKQVLTRSTSERKQLPTPSSSTSSSERHTSNSQLSNEKEKLKEKLKNKEKLTFRERINLLKNIDMRSSSSVVKEEQPKSRNDNLEKNEMNGTLQEKATGGSKLPPMVTMRRSSRNKPKNSEYETSSQSGNELPVGGGQLEEENSKFESSEITSRAEHKSMEEAVASTNLEMKSSEVADGWKLYDENAEKTNDEIEKKFDHPEQYQQRALPPVPLTPLQQPSSSSSSSKAEPKKLFSPQSFLLEKIFHFPAQPSSEKVSSSSSPEANEKEEIILVQQFEEFLFSITDIIRSLFAFTEDLELKIEYYLLLGNSFLPHRVQQFFHYIAPLLKQFAVFLELFFVFILIILEVLIEVLSYLWNQWKNESPELLLGIIFGVIFCFFGSFFFTTIAAFESFRLFGYDRLLISIKQINDDLKKLKHSSQRFSAALVRHRSISTAENNSMKSNNESSAKEQQPDITTAPVNDDDTKKSECENSIGVFNNNTPSLPASFLLQSTFSTLASINPNHLFQAVFVLNAGLLAALTTLKIQFAKTITLGNSVALMLEKPVFYFLEPIFVAVLPTELAVWGQFFLKLGLKFLAISISWTLQRFLSLFHSSIRGGLLISKNFITYLLRTDVLNRYLPNFLQFLPPKVQENKDLVIYGLGYGLAVVGMIFQFTYRNALPFPFSYLFFPFLLVERTLIWLVNNSSFVFQNM